jgi:phasin
VGDRAALEEAIMAEDKDNIGGSDPAAAMRTAAERSVEQARKAFDDMMNMAQKAVAGAESAQAQVQGRVRDMTKETLDFAGASAAAALDLVERLARARDPQEALAIQKAYLEAQMQRLGQQARTMGDGAIRAAQDLTKPFER